MVLENSLNDANVDYLIDLQEQLEEDLINATDGYIAQSIQVDLDMVNEKLQELVSNEYKDSDTLTNFVNSF